MSYFGLENLATSERVALVLLLAVGAHIGVRLIRYLGQHLMSGEALRRWNKLRTLVGLFFSTLVFVIYFGSFGLALQEFGVSLTAYLASASVLGLAIGFGSQGVVQDVVTGLTVILSDLFQVGDLVEISGQTGIVQSISMRFTTLLNPLGARVFIPNRTLSSVVIYPRGYLRCLADISISQNEGIATEMQARIDAITQGFIDQFPGIQRYKPEISPPESTPSGRRFIRVKFRIWPGRSTAIETSFKAEILRAMKLLDSDYADWMVSVGNEIGEAPRAIEPFRRRHNRARPDS